MRIKRPTDLHHPIPITPIAPIPLLIQILTMKLTPPLMRRIPLLSNLPMTRQTLPTKLPLTLPTSHMIAPITLLNAPSTTFPRADFTHFIEDCLGGGFVLGGFAASDAVVVGRAGFAGVPGGFVEETLFVAAAAEGSVAFHVVAVLDVELAGGADGGEAPGELGEGGEGVSKQELFVLCESGFVGEELHSVVLQGRGTFGAFQALAAFGVELGGEPGVHAVHARCRTVLAFIGGWSCWKVEDVFLVATAHAFASTG